MKNWKIEISLNNALEGWKIKKKIKNVLGGWKIEKILNNAPGGWKIKKNCKMPKNWFLELVTSNFVSN